ncbi:SpoIID/LytB domain-containing protein [Nocardioides sp. zg-DK7169]|uniref:SpoIID/LytB domain-containing protein n=1 Tax=Nocardioides sp. zg-DK7169 TaxID=2736600 RepID=UPI00155486E3|nr:SpoIID/LytB domain-containing protein [Nocardioides sp. zg-DK7169]NPC95688.1 SpoIID/LytB domain-containing protein [Nocardioides sp. zg-DK7169]
MTPRLRVLAAGLGLALGAALVPPAAAATPEPRPHPRKLASVTFEGRGYGHGKGLSQYGAKVAAEKGVGYREILDFYYPGTTWGRIAGKVSVLVSADTSDDVVVDARSGLRVTALRNRRTWDLAAVRPAAVRWRLVAASPTRTRVDFRARTGGWRTWRTVGGDAQFAAGGRPVTLRTPSGVVAYRGALRSASAQPGSKTRDTVNIVSLHNYLKGVVPQEVPALWNPDAVRAQSVAARTYAAFERRQPLARHYQICDTTSCQVYGGASAEHPASNAAIDATRGEVLLHGGTPAFTQFSSSNGGWTMAGSFPYLQARKDPWDPVNPWRATIPAAAFEKAWPGLGPLETVSVTARNGDGAWGGRVSRMRIVFRDGAVNATGDQVRSYLGLRSTWFRPAG